jgi:hypothetical protein
MGRARRAADGGIVYRVLNRANARMPIFESDQDFAAFERILTEARDRYDMRILAYCLSTRFAATRNGTPCVPCWWSKPSSGVGRVFGAGSTALPRRRRSCRLGPCRGRATGRDK